jgi:hypothetical protein
VGPGAVVSLAYRAGVDDPVRFAKSKSVGAFFGLTPKRYQSGETDVTGAITRVGDASVRTALHDAANALLLRATKFSTLKRWAMDVAKRRGMRRAKVALARKLATVLHRIWVDGTEFVWGKDPARRQRYNAKEANSSERGQGGPAPMKSLRRDAEMVRQVPLQWPGAILRLRPVDCSATPSYSMKWWSHADHGQKQETGDWMHSELDNRGPITEAAEPKVRFSCLSQPGWPRL